MRLVLLPGKSLSRGDFSLGAPGFVEKTSAGRSCMARARAALPPTFAGLGSRMSRFGGASSTGKFDRLGKMPFGPNFVVDPVAGKSKSSPSRRAAKSSWAAERYKAPCKTPAAAGF